MSAEPLLGSIEWVAHSRVPVGWARCDGQVLPIHQHSALFSLLGTTYGGDGRTTFRLPDLRGRTPMGVGNGPRNPRRTSLGEPAGSEEVTLTVAELPAHAHTVPLSDAKASRAAPDSAAHALAGGSRAFVDPSQADSVMVSDYVEVVGESQPHTNMQPFLTLNALIAIEGVFPARP